MSSDLLFGVLIIVGTGEKTDRVFYFAKEAIKRGYAPGGVLLVGGEFRHISASEAAIAGVTIVADNASRVFEQPLRKEAYENQPPYQAPTRMSGYAEMVSIYRTSDFLVTYMCLDDTLARNAFELAALVCTGTFANRKWLVGSNARNMVDSNLFTVKPYELPKLFSGDRSLIAVRDTLIVSEKIAMKELVIQGIDLLRAHLITGFHIKKNVVPIPGWALQIKGTWLALIIGEFNIKPGSEDLSHREETIESSAMRAVLCHATLGVLSNYFYFGFPTNTFVSADSIKEFARTAPLITSEDQKFLPTYDSPTYDLDILGWTNPAMWESIRAQYVAFEGV
jgi:hypothetical protein